MSPNPTPWDFNEAVTASREAGEAQASAEVAREQAAAEFAEKERLYREALAAEIVKTHADGAAWTVAQDLARGEKHVAQLRFDRDVAQGIKDAIEQQAWRRTADRKDVTELIQWSRVIAPLGEQPEPKTLGAPIGGRRAA